MRWIVLTAVLWILPSVARAERGTYGLFELRLGSNWGAGAQAGLAGGVSLGATLKPRGSPIRFYPLINLDGQHLPPTHLADGFIERHQLQATGSLRVVIPVIDRWLRVFGEGGVGLRFGRVRVAQTPALLTQEGGGTVLQLGGGLQFRVHRNVSFGVRTLYQWTPPASDLAFRLQDAANDDVQAVAMLGFHF